MALRGRGNPRSDLRGSMIRRSPYLSTPAKMPGWSFNLPAGRACPAARLANKKLGDQSGCHSCYALTGNYLRPTVRSAQERRFKFVLDSLANDGGDTFVYTMIAEIRRCVAIGDPYFRIHDSGDFFSPAYAECWYRICAAIPEVHFWAPTREWSRPLMLPALRKLASLPNVAIRPSALGVTDAPPVVLGLHAGTNIIPEFTAGPVCPATGPGDHTCDAHGCRSCWLKKDQPVHYVVHGNRAGRFRRALPVLEAVV